MGPITLVTPPSIIENKDKTFCIINFSESDKDQFMNFLNQYYYLPTDSITVYIADQQNDQNNVKWLTEVMKKSYNIIIKSTTEFVVLKSNEIKNLEEFFNGR